MLLLLSFLFLADPSACPSAITVEKIRPVRGEGYTWVRATYAGAPADATAPTWEAEGASIREYNEDPMVAYIGAPTGKYTVRATGPCGVVGEAVIEHVAWDGKD